MLLLSDILIADFTFRANEVGWPSYFSVCVEYAMAVVFATALSYVIKASLSSYNAKSICSMLLG